MFCPRFLVRYCDGVSYVAPVEEFRSARTRAGLLELISRQSNRDLEIVHFRSLLGYFSGRFLRVAFRYAKHHYSVLPRRFTLMCFVVATPIFETSALELAPTPNTHLKSNPQQMLLPDIRSHSALCKEVAFLKFVLWSI